MQDFRYSNGVAEVSILLGYDAISLGNWFLMFSDMASCHSRTETLRYFDVITSLVSLIYWGFRCEKVTSQH
jgi:hypothetical protein